MSSNSVVLLWSMKLKVLRMVSFGVILSGIFLTFATAIALHYDRVMNMTLCAETISDGYAALSNVTGSYYPEKFFWQLTIIAHVVLSFWMGFIYRVKFLSSLPGRSYALCCTRFMVTEHILENLWLLILTLVGVEENFPVHGLAFCAFILNSLGYMLSNIILMISSGRQEKFSLTTKLSVVIKINLFLTNLIATFFLMYAYPQYSLYCKRWAYASFTVVEYLLVFCNIFYHCTFFLDLQSYKLEVYCKWKSKKNEEFSKISDC